jgi:hypothetical protein
MPVTEEFLISVPLPPETKSYKPVSHQEVIEKTREMITLSGLAISSEEFSAADSGNIFSGSFTISPTKTGDRYFNTIAVQNSYNKRVTLKYAYGIHDSETGAKLLTGDIAFKRKHTGSVVAEFDEVLSKTISFITDYRDEIINDINLMRVVRIDRSASAELCGRLFFNHEVINTNQLTSLKNSFKSKIRSPFNGKESTDLWTLYSFISKELSNTHASDQIDKYIGAHQFLKISFGII